VQTILRDLGAIAGVQYSCVVRRGEVLATTFPEDQKAAQSTSLEFVRGVTDGLELVDRGFGDLILDLGSRSLFAAPVEKDFVLALFAGSETNPQLIRIVMGSAVRQIQRMLDIAAAPQPAAAPPPKPPVVEAAPPPPPPPPPPPQQAKPQPQPPPQPQKPQPQPPQGQANKGAPPAAKPQAAQPQRPQQPPQQAKGPQPKAPEPAKPEPPKAQPKPEPPPPPPPPKPTERDVEPVLPKVLALLAERIGPVARVSFKRGVAKWQESTKPTMGNLGELAKILAADLSTEAEKDAFVKAVERLKSE
jgi:predicted regulator of Ras-like GTPase activity (Roadblock/LC7/MglB family)